MRTECTCQICHCVIRKNLYRNPKYCSWNCYQIAHAAVIKQAVCPICEKLFSVSVNKKETKTYCSSECSHRSRINLGHKYISSNGYVYVKTSPKVYSLEHRVVMEKVLGRKLNSQEHVHHKNGNIIDNRPENLQLFESNSAHCKYHHDNWIGVHPKDSPESITKRTASRKAHQANSHCLQHTRKR